MTLNCYPQLIPCEDFSGFVCGNYDETSDSINPFAKVEETIYEQGRKLLEEPIADFRDFEGHQKAKNFYRSCMDNENQTKQQAVKLLQDLLKKIGGKVIKYCVRPNQTVNTEISVFLVWFALVGFRNTKLNFYATKEGKSLN